MTKTKKIVGGILGIILLISAVGHMVNPALSSGLIPDFLPKDLVHLLTSLVEAGLGLGVFLPKYRSKALLGICILMILFLPLHVVDLFRENPVIGSQTAAIVRIPLQFLLIYLAWFARK